MLDLLYKRPLEGSPLQAVLPWLDYLSPELVLCKDGSILAGYHFTGLDPDNLDEDLVDQVTEQVQRSISQFDSRVTAWWLIDKRRDFSYPESEFTNRGAALLDRLIGNAYRRGITYRFRRWLFLLYTPAGGADGYFETVSRLTNEEGMSFPAAVVRGAFSSISTSEAAMRDASRLQAAQGDFETILAMFSSTVPAIQLQRMGRREFEVAFHHLTNVASRLPAGTKPGGVMFDGWLPTGEVTPGRSAIAFQSEGDVRYCAAIGINQWPAPTTPGLFEALLASDVEMTICHIIRFLSNEQAKAQLDDAINYYRMTQFSPINYVAQKLTDAPAEPDSGKQDLLEECMEAKRRLSGEGLGFALHNLSVLVYAGSPDQLETDCLAVHGRLADANFQTTRERLNLMPTWEAMLPGQWSRQTRFHEVSLETVANSLPLFTMSEGSHQHTYFSEVLRRPVSALAIFIDGYGGRYHYVPHVGQVGHAVIVAPTGMGKTTFANLCLSQFRRYDDIDRGEAQVFIFDRGHSCRIVTELHDGKHIDMASGTMRCNPLAPLRDGSADGLLWVREWIIRRIEEGGYRCNAQDREDIDLALVRLRDTSQELRLSALAIQLPAHLTLQLGEWLEGRPYGMFDSVEDTYELASWTCTEMIQLLAVERLARAFIDYAFRKLFAMLDGRPTFVYIEESSFLLSNPAFAPRLDEILKTLRARGGFVWLTMQSPTSITSSEISATLTDNVLTKILLANKAAETHRKAYRDHFGLTDENVDVIKALMPQREYLIVSNGFARVVQPVIPAEALPFLRAEQFLQKVFDRHRDSGSPNWKAHYLAEAAKL